jgi:hypothetical protein
MNAALPVAIDTVSKALVDDFPEGVRDSIAEGAVERCKVVAAAAA